MPVPGSNRLAQSQRRLGAGRHCTLVHFDREKGQHVNNVVDGVRSLDSRSKQVPALENAQRLHFAERRRQQFLVTHVRGRTSTADPDLAVRPTNATIVTMWQHPGICLNKATFRKARTSTTRIPVLTWPYMVSGRRVAQRRNTPECDGSSTND